MRTASFMIAALALTAACADDQQITGLASQRQAGKGIIIDYGTDTLATHSSVVGSSQREFEPNVYGIRVPDAPTVGGIKVPDTPAVYGIKVPDAPTTDGIKVPDAKPRRPHR